MKVLHVTVVGSVNLDVVATGPRLPAPGETVTGARLAHHPGGKGANQALAASRLGCHVSLVARVGRDANAAEALSLLRAAGVDVSAVHIDDAAATGVALIAVAPDGENQIIVAPGANATFMPGHLPELRSDAILCQLELPVSTVERVLSTARGFLALNLAPAVPVPVPVLMSADLLIVNDAEAAFFGAALHRGAGLVAVTHGALGASLWRAGTQIAVATPPAIQAVDSTGAGDAFAAALTVALVEGQPPAVALQFACAAGAVAAAGAGAQPSLPMRAQVEALLRRTGAA